MPRRPKETIARELVAVRLKIEPLLASGNALREEMRALCEEERCSFTVDVVGKGKVVCIFSPTARPIVDVILNAQALPKQGVALPPVDLSE